MLAADRDIGGALAEIMGSLRKGYEIDTTILQRTQALQGRIRGLLSEAYRAVHGELKDDLIAAAKHEVEWAGETYRKVLQLGRTLELPSAQMLRTIVTARPFQGRILKDWSRQLEVTALHRVISQINLGMVEAESIDQIASRLTDTALVQNKRSAEAVEVCSAA